ncbi:WhiB family transcriptional regulator [Corynebacterium sp. NPDC060344]|uniref:WhiB family transcriptional regulator n=1 Tax=Corynebacterium sp. NPDC060344 TaxID=3347101 RepID=UPI00365B1561
MTRRKPEIWPTVKDMPDIRPILRGPRLTGALCIGRGKLFDDYLHRESAEARAARHDAARRLCARCPAAPECAALANQLPAEHRQGVWAGHLHEEPQPQRKDLAA